MVHPITREYLNTQPGKVLSPGRNWTKGQVRLLEWEGRPIVIKDYRPTHPLVRGLLGRWFVRHEEAVFRELSGVHGVPDTLGPIDRFAFAREFVDGRPLQTFRCGEVSPDTFRALEAIIRNLHSHGITHGDLHHRDIIIDAAGNPFVIDFSSAVRRGGKRNPVRGWLFRQSCRMDLRSVFKLKSRFLETPLSREESVYLDRAPLLHRIGKSLRRLIRR
jgi:predicted Ser/Thr protein kinase